MTKTDPNNFTPWQESCSALVKSHLQLPSIEGLSGELEYDVAIIGGGIAGLSALDAIAQSGMKAALFDGHPNLGLGASGKNAGIFCAGINMPITYTPKGSPAAALWSATHHMLLAILEEAAQPESMLYARRVGALALATSPTAGKRLVQETRARNQAAMSAEMINAKDLDKITQGFLDVSTVHSAMFLPDEGTIHPLTLLATVANRARKNGGELYGAAPIGQIKKAHDGWILSSQFGIKIKCRALISAIGPILNPTGRIFALSFRYEPPAGCPVWWDANPYIYYDYRPGNGFLTVSGGRYGAPQTDKADRKYHVKMAQAARKWVPDFACLEPSHAWAVDLNVSPDMLPEITELGENHLSIHGLGALGVLPGIVLGRQAGDRTVTKLRSEKANSRS